jgi:lipopolysaccharide cholinephosphotransferase
METKKELLNRVAKTMDILRILSDEEKNSLQKCLLTIYQDVSGVCSKYNLCIMLSGGSALGAVRHQGFIPWDDDLDAMMPRKDYDKLIEIFESELGDKYLLSVPRVNNVSELLFMKIKKKNTVITYLDGFTDSVGIDVFPIENTPDNKLIRSIKGYTADILKLIITSNVYYKSKNIEFKKCFMVNFKTKSHYYFRYFIGLMFSSFIEKYLYDVYDKYVSNSKGTKYCTIPTGRKFYAGEIHQQDVFFPPNEALFEGMKVNIPRDIDSYLRRLYGDYMQIPPLEKQERRFFSAIDLDTKKIVT